MTTLATLDRFRVNLRGHSFSEFRGLIRECIDVDAKDDVEAASAAKALMTEKYKDRPAMSWRVMNVQILNEKV